MERKSSSSIPLPVGAEPDCGSPPAQALRLAWAPPSPSLSASDLLAVSDVPAPLVSYSSYHSSKAPTAHPGSVLFDYLGRPTHPEISPVRGDAGALGSEPRTGDDTELVTALSHRPVAAWNDRDGSPTLRPEPGRTPSRLAPARDLRLMGTLTRIDGPTAGLVVALPADQLTIGRSKHADLHLTDDGVSRKHARICWIDGAYVLEDLGSQNGTFVNDQSQKATRLEHGDLIHIGTTVTLRFCWMDQHQKKLIAELYETSVRDPLTGAFNRRHFSERLDGELAYARRHQSELSLLLLDIDYFKKINDQYGHLEGDRVLRILAQVAHQHLRTEDTFARYGGEEFAVVLRGVPLMGAIRAAERLRQAIAHKVLVGSPPLAVSVSIGCASLGCIDDHGAVNLIRVADQRLYEAKLSGRGRVVASGYSGG